MKRARVLSGRGLAVALAMLLATTGSAFGELKPGRSLEIANGLREDPVYLRELAEGRYLDGDLEGAIGLYQEVARLEVEPREQAAALVNASWLQFLLDREEASLTAMSAALRAHPELELDSRLYSDEFEKIYLGARVLVARANALREARSEPPAPLPAGAEAVYHRGVEALERGDEEAALGLLQRAASLTYGAGTEHLDLRRRALLRLGLLYYDRRQWGDAATAFEEAVGLDRGDTAAWRRLGLARLNQGEPAAAVVAFREAYARRPDSLDNARNLAQALVRSGRWEDAASWIDDATRHHERNAHLRLLLAEAHAGRGAQQRAAEAWRAAMELDDSLDWTYGRQAALRLGLAHLEREHYAEAAAVSRAALEHDPTDATFWNLLGLSQQGDGQAAEARDSFLRACHHDDARAEYRNNLGRAYAAVGDLPRAEQEFVHALTLEPDLPAAQANLAQVRELLRAQ